jgi:hypothetical protein
LYFFFSSSSPSSCVFSFSNTITIIAVAILFMFSSQPTPVYTLSDFRNSHTHTSISFVVSLPWLFLVRQGDQTFTERGLIPARRAMIQGKGTWLDVEFLTRKVYLHFFVTCLLGERKHSISGTESPTLSWRYHKDCWYTVYCDTALQWVRLLVNF